MFSTNLVKPELSMSYVQGKDQTNIQILLAIILGYSSILLGFYAKSATKFAQKVSLNNISEKTVFKLSAFFLLFACVSIYLFSSQYGGVLYAISNANLIRNGAIEGGSLGYFKRFMYFAFNASYLLAALIFIGKNQKINIFALLLFLLSLFVSLIGSLIVAARSTMLVAFVIFYLVYVLQTKKWHLKFLVPLLVSSILFILYGKAFFFSLTGLPDGFDAVVTKFTETINRHESSNYDFGDLINTFAYPIYSLYAAFNEYYPLRLFTDWFLGIISFLPERFIHVEQLLDKNAPYTMSYFNTLYLVNTDEYDIPTGYLAACVYSLSWPGVFFFSFIYGWIGRYLQTMMLNHIKTIYWMPFMYIVTAKVWSDFLTYGDPKTFLQTNFCYLIFIMILLFLATRQSPKYIIKNVDLSK
ncbi:MAG: hypothetical protein Kow0049_01390 [Stanieria sp.]